MRLLFVSNYFPPEVNAPATRLFEHARQWVADGHEVEVLTSVPHFPEGRVYDGHANRFKQEVVSGIDVTRVPMYVTANSGTIKRTLSYVSFMLSTLLFFGRVRRKPDVVVGTSPQFFCAIGAYLIARFWRLPFVLEIRDLWPESIVAVGAVRRGLIIRVFEFLERYLYLHADHIVVVTDAFQHHITGKGVPPERISVVKNGADLSTYTRDLDPDVLADMKHRHGLEGKFVASYIGTIGMAHRADVLFEAAARCSDPDIVFLVVGAGAERPALEARQAAAQLPNFRLLDKQPKALVPYLLGMTDVSVVHLQKSPLFRTVIPSKIFESMATRKPIILGVEGESQEIIEGAGCGIAIEPENVQQLVDAVVRLKNDPALYDDMAQRGLSFVYRMHDRSVLARRYWSIAACVAQRRSVPSALRHATAPEAETPQSVTID